MADKPSFLIGVDETPEEKDIMDVLRDPVQENQNDSSNNGADDPAPSDEAGKNTDEPVKPTGDEGGDDDSQPGDKNTDPDKSTPTGDEPGDDGGKAPTTPDGKTTPDADKTKPGDETPEQAAKRQIELKFGTFKSPEDAEKAFKEMQRTLTRLTTQKPTAPVDNKKPQDEDQLAKYTKIASTQPLVDVKLPKAENYRFDDGSFDLDSYGRDIVKSTVMALQQSLIGGQLGAMQFGLLQQAMNEEYRTGVERNTSQEKAATIEQKIYKEYPIFKSNEKAAALMEKAIYGEASKRKMLAEKAGKEPEAMTEEDYLSLAKDLVESFNIPVAPQTQDPTDKPGITPTMQPTGKGKMSVADQDIDAMMNVKNKSGSIF